MLEASGRHGLFAAELFPSGFRGVAADVECTALVNGSVSTSRPEHNAEPSAAIEAASIPWLGVALNTVWPG